MMAKARRLGPFKALKRYLDNKGKPRMENRPLPQGQPEWKPTQRPKP